MGKRFLSVVTVNNSYNYGSFLQASSLLTVLSQYGNAFLYDTETRSVWRDCRIKIKRRIKEKNNFFDKVHGILFELIEAGRLAKQWRKLPLSKTKKTDIAILGSDEIWNVSRKACRYPVLWGEGLNAKTIAYAPSVNNAEYTDFVKYPQYMEYAKNIDYVSVRDQHSQNIIKEIINIEPTIVLDPTLLLDPVDHPFSLEKPYIAIYLFGWRLNDSDIEVIKSIAKEKGCLLVSAGMYLPWCDYSVHSVNGSPFYIYKNAEYVITNTFHGTAYALNYKKQFTSYVKDQSKTFELLKQFNLESRFTSESKEISHIMNETIDYDSISSVMDVKRKESIRYIEKALNNQ